MVGVDTGNKNNRRKAIGAIGEDRAAEFLEKQGYKVVLRNYWKPWGEIDIIAEKMNLVHFIEVKSVCCDNLPDVLRETNEYHPEELVNRRKIRKIIRTAEIYMNHTKDGREFQIDAVSVFLDMRRHIARCRIFEQVL